MYRSEAAFSHALCFQLKKQGAMVTRIESGYTKVGIPDIHMVYNGAETWIEVKNIHKYWDGRSIEIPWRPGQQAWALTYLKHKKSYSLTIASCKNGILIIPMVKHFESNLVTKTDISEFLHTIGEIRI